VFITDTIHKFSNHGYRNYGYGQPTEHMYIILSHQKYTTPTHTGNLKIREERPLAENYILESTYHGM
jgi:hypothetical protein